MRRPAVLLIPVLALATVAGTASAGELRALRLVQSESGTRVELQLDAESDARLFELHDPDRLVIDLPSTRAAPGFRLPGANGAVANLRTGQPTPGTLRVVFDLGMPVRTAHRFEANGQGRVLVVDLVSPDAVLAPTRSASAAPAAASGSVPASIVALSRRENPARVRQPGVGTASSDMRVWTQSEVSSVAEPLRDGGTSDYSDPMPLQADAAPVFADPSTPATIATIATGVPVSIEASPSSLPVPPASPARTDVRPRRPSLRASRAGSPLDAFANARAAVPVPEATTPATRAPSRTMRDVIGRGQRKLIVAIDAGHGGKDPGAHGPSGVREKAVTLAVARELARQVNADPGMRAVLIRDGDQFVPLKTRYMKARAAQADLFISIHADASLNDSATGASVFVLSTRGASSQAARWLADSENAADLVGGVSLDSRDHNLAAVLLDLSQSATMRASDDVAQQVLGALMNVGKAHKPSLERANFVVLRSPDVPSMLVETGFITNPGEEQRLNDSGYRARLAAAITEGVRRYFVGQPPPGSWYAARSATNAADGGTPQVASAPD